MSNLALTERADRVITTYHEKRLRIVTAESCTGGLLAGALTNIAGASAVFERGFVTYSNAAKVDLLGVLPDLLEQHGAVSGEVAEAMAEGALAYSLANVAIAITGIAGPDGGTLNKPVGLVFIGLARKEGSTFHYRCQFQGKRDQIRFDAVMESLNLLLTAVDERELRF